MRYFISILFCIALISISSCRKDFSTVASFGQLEFSKDTIFLDTVFSNIGSATYNLKVYNKSNKAITIPSIQLENGINSNYRLNVDGIAGNNFEDIDVLANDSMFVFIETTIDFNSISNPLYTDRILFDNGNHQQDVDLVTLVQDANFIFPGRDEISMEIDSLVLDGVNYAPGRFLTDTELTFTKAKPTVIYGFAAVPANKTLTIEAGARIHFHDNSGLIVDKGATLKSNGTLAENVVFEGDRLEHSFSEIPGQWGTIWMRAGSKDNELHFTEIRNGIVGVLVDSIGSTSTPTLTLKNTKIYNNSAFSLLGRNTNILGENVVIGNSGQASLAGIIGGTYNFTHSTFANYWNNSSLRELPTVLINNFFKYTDNNGEEAIATRDLIAANFTNCIIDGNSNIEFILDKIDGSAFNYSVKNSLITFNDFNNSYANNAELDFTNSNYSGIILNGNSHFKDTSKNDFSIGEESDAINNALPSAITQDILGVDRTTNPDIGAYQHIIFE